MDIETTPVWPEIVAHKNDLTLRELAARFEIPVVVLALAFKRTGEARTAKPTSPRSPTPPGAAAPELRAWRVLLRGRARPIVLLADRFATALAIATQRGEVLAVDLLGPAL